MLSSSMFETPGMSAYRAAATPFMFLRRRIHVSSKRANQAACFGAKPAFPWAELVFDGFQISCLANNRLLGRMKIALAMNSR